MNLTFDIHIYSFSCRLLPILISKTTIVSEKSFVLPFFQYKSIRDQFILAVKMSKSTQVYHLSKLDSFRVPDAVNSFNDIGQSVPKKKFVKGCYHLGHVTGII